MTKPAGPIRRGLPPAAAGIPAPADKRFRRSDVRLGKRRTWRVTLVRLAIAGGALAGSLALMGWALNAVADAAMFSIDRIEVRGTARLTPDGIRALIGDLTGQSVFRVDLDVYRERLHESPWVASATLRRVFPSSVEVVIVERTPLLIARKDRQLYLVDATGTIIDTAGPAYREFDLPIVDGLLTMAGGGAAADPQRIALVDRLISDLAPRSDLARRLSQVDVSDPRNAVVLLDGEPARLFLGDAQFLERLQRFEDVSPSIREQFPAVDYYELRYDRVFVGPAKGRW